MTPSTWSVNKHCLRCYSSVSVRIYKVSHFSSILEKAGPMLTAPHTGLACRFKLLSLSLPYPNHHPHAPPILPPYQPANLALAPVISILSPSPPLSLPSLPPCPQEHLVFKLRLHLTSTKNIWVIRHTVEFTKLVHRKKGYSA